MNASHIVISRRELVKKSLVSASVAAVGLLVSDISSVRLAHASEDVQILSEDVMEYSSYLQTLDFQSLTRVAIAEDGYWGMGTTSVWQSYLYNLEVTGYVEHQWRSNISANPGLTSGWYCDSTLAGDPTIVAIQAHSWSGESDGIMGSTTIRAIQARVGTAQDGVLSAPSTCIRTMQSNFANYNRPWFY